MKKLLAVLIAGAFATTVFAAEASAPAAMENMEKAKPAASAAAKTAHKKTHHKKAQHKKAAASKEVASK